MYNITYLKELMIVVMVTYVSKHGVTIKLFTLGLFNFAMYGNSSLYQNPNETLHFEMHSQHEALLSLVVRP